MKKITLGLSLLAIMATVSCKKDDKGTSGSVSPSDVPSTVMGKKWLLTAYKYNYTGVDVDGYSSLPSCQADNTIEFKSDYTNELDEGPTKCSSTAPQTSIEGNWELRSGNTEIYISGFAAAYGIDALTLKILSLNSSTLKVQYTTDLGGITAVNTATYTAK